MITGRRVLGSLGLLLLPCLALFARPGGQADAAQVDLRPGRPLAAELPRYGLNLGGSGTWGAEQGLPVVTYEFPLLTPDAAAHQHVPVLVELLTQPR